VNAAGQGGQLNPTAAGNQFFRAQEGLLLSGPIWRRKDKSGEEISSKTHFLLSYERHTLRQQQQTSFSVPTPDQRQICPVGDRACASNVLFSSGFFPSSLRGDALWSLYPFPNNPLGPYGGNTYTESLSSDGNGNLFLAGIDSRFGARNTISFRYNGTDESSIVPSTGSAIFSSVKPTIFTQDAALLLDSVPTEHVANTLRISYGGTISHFSQLRDPYLEPSNRGNSYLLNAPLLLNVTTSGSNITYQPAGSTAASNPLAGLVAAGITDEFFGVASGKFPVSSDQLDTGALGRLSVGGFSTVGPDTFQIPQRRRNDTFQVADTVLWTRGIHRFTFGFDVRRVDLSNVAFPPEASANYDGIVATPFSTVSQAGVPQNPIFSPASLVSTGLAAAAQTFPIIQCAASFAVTDNPPSAPCQTPSNYLSLDLGAYQADEFIEDNVRMARNFRLIAGIRARYAPVPQDLSGHFTEAFNPNTAVSIVAGCSSPTCSGLRQAISLLVPTGLMSAFDPSPFGIDGRLGFAWDVRGDGKLVVRGGLGTYSGQFPALLVDEARNVFPQFLTLTGGANTNFAPGQAARYGFDIYNGSVYLPPGKNAGDALAALSTTATNNSISANLIYPATGLKNPYAEQANLTVEQRIADDALISLAYVGTAGKHLLSESTPEGGPNRNTVDYGTCPTVPLGTPSPLGSTPCPAPSNSFPFPNVATLFNPAQEIARRFYVTPILLGGEASSTYHSLQATIGKEFSNGYQFSTAFTWSHAIDNASDFLSLAGSFPVAQNSESASERGSSNFDVRFRSATQFLADSSSFLHRFGGYSRGTMYRLLSSWQLSGVLVLQTGQPYTINTAVDVNEDGNATDRLKDTGCLRPGTNPRQQWQISPACVDPLLETGVEPQATGYLAAPGLAGLVGRNTFTGFSLYNLDFSISRSFVISDAHRVVVRMEGYNALNHPNFGIPDRILESPSFGRAVNTVAPPRIVQFALKYSF